MEIIRELSKKVRRHGDTIVPRHDVGHLERAGGGCQQQDQAHRAHGLRIQKHRQPHRARHAALLGPSDFTSRKGLIHPQKLAKPRKPRIPAVGIINDRMVLYNREYPIEWIWDTARKCSEL